MRFQHAVLQCQRDSRLRIRRPDWKPNYWLRGDRVAATREDGFPYYWTWTLVFDDGMRVWHSQVSRRDCGVFDATADDWQVFVPDWRDDSGPTQIGNADPDLLLSKLVDGIAGAAS